MINRENLVKIGRAGGKTSNRETDPIKSGGLESLGVRTLIALHWGSLIFNMAVKAAEIGRF